MKKQSAFLVHLGDINSGKDAAAGKTDESTYANMRSMLTTSNSIPTYIVPGDNEWNDHKTPDLAWGWWNKHLLSTEEATSPSWTTERQTERKENFAFTHKGVLIIGINLVGGRIHDAEEWKQRFEHNQKWINTQLTKHADDVHSAVICCQANMVGQGAKAPKVRATFLPFMTPVLDDLTAFKKPILVLHADGHKWTVDKPWNETAPNVTRVQLDQVKIGFPPVRITVTGDLEKPFKLYRRMEEKMWQFPRSKSN